MAESSPRPEPLTAPPLPISVRVPASTSNLGPGFDFLGLALGLMLEVTVSGPANGANHELTSLGGAADTWPQSEDNLLTRALDFVVRRAGRDPRPMRIRAHSDIPTGRGFGSSGAATVAGLLLGHALVAEEASLDTLISDGAHLEGHPDNTTASLLGGCTLAIPAQTKVSARGSVLDQPSWKVVRQALHPAIGFAIAWPERPLPTREGRSALPERVTFLDAIENPRRVAALLEGLRSGDPELLALGGEDRLHVRYRLPLIPGGAEALDAARSAGAWLATVSGSGSGLIALAPRPACADVARAMAEALQTEQGHATGRVVEPALTPPQVVHP